ncbi:serine/threonine-protein kinase Nek8-like [Anneissia japonica]|uniref:serine/threonine-protein kinase Nek8-like n=1 Tax=Anneissia japonica TaxID=1529436 RepID=UPI0014256991|nr:serine/threonine-protein kinase Nek8-like [Anneissia japonica]
MENYEKLRIVGRGAFGTVHLCRRLTDKKLVIVKQIPVEQMTREERQAALNEVKVLSMLDHPNIIEYYENYLEGTALMIVMEYAEGGTLCEYLQQQGNTLLEEHEILHFFAQILLSLHHIHSKQILHRDLKTQNILLTKQRDIVKIGDFGISKILNTKSKAQTVVGTPCYISPELCEGKPYNQKSDIWALGCVLYELATLKRAFEGPNLPALVLKIMRGAVAPVSDKYSKDLHQLILRMLHLTPEKRPTITQVMAEPIIINSLFNLHSEIGRVKCEKKLPPLPPLTPRIIDGRSNSRASHRSMSKNVILDGSGGLPKPTALSTIFCWGNNISPPIKLPLPHNDTQVMQVSTGRNQRAAVTKNGRLLLWESPVVGAESMLPGAMDPEMPSFIPRFLEGQSAVTIKHVSCGDLFTACLTDRGILMTYGSGAHGCLGHGNYHDVTQAKIVEALLGYEIIMVSCGASHVMAVTNEHEVFAWGRGDNGRLGLGNADSTSSPQPVPLEDCYQASSIHCGVDCSALLTTNKQLLACGSNRFNKLHLDTVSSDGNCTQQVEDVHVFTQAATYPLNQLEVRHVALGTSHAAVITDQDECYMSGSNQFGQLGFKSEKASTRQPHLLQLPGDTRIHLISCGDMFTTAVSTDGEVFSWGKASRGRLGRKDGDNFTPSPLNLLDDEIEVTSISSSHGNTLMAAKTK